MEESEARVAGKKTSIDFERCLRLGGLITFEASDEMYKREIDGAEYDLVRAEESLAKNDLKWASLQAFHSMYHSVRIMILSKGYLEKSQRCLMVALKDLYVSTGEIMNVTANNLELCMEIKKETENGNIPSEESTRMCIDSAKTFLSYAIKILPADLGF